MTYRESLMKKILFVLMLGLVGCATPLQHNQAWITFISVPPGAMLYQGQDAWGIAPQVKFYEFKSLNNPHTLPVTAVWASGAQSTTFFNVTLGISQTATFSRPRNAPGLDKDLMFAEQLRQADAARSAESDAALAAALRAFKPPVTTNCTKIGNSVNCTSQ